MDGGRESLEPGRLATPGAWAVGISATRRLPAWATLRRLLGLDRADIPPIVVLGLIAVTIGCTLLEYLTAQAGQGPTAANALGLVLPTAGALVLDAALLRLPPRRLSTLGGRVLALLVVAVVARAAQSLPLPWDEIAAITSYGAVVAARISGGQARAWPLTGALVLGFMPLGLGGERLLSPGAFAIWLAGLLFVAAFTDQSVAERAARLHGEGLVRELRAAQDRLRALATQAGDLATLCERARLARELHDTLAQGLTAITLYLDRGDTVFDASPLQTRQALRRAREIAQTHLRETRATVLALRAEARPPLPLPAALAALAAAWQPWDGSDTGAATFHADDAIAPIRTAPAVELTCYRVAQEALQNAARHGRARHVAVELSLEPDGLCLSVTDDGCGFDLAAARPASGYPGVDGGLGLLGMRERVELLGGRLDVISAPGTGAHIVATLPLPTPGAPAATAEEG